MRQVSARSSAAGVTTGDGQGTLTRWPGPGRKVDIPSYQVKPGQSVGVRDRSAGMQPFAAAAEGTYADERTAPYLPIATIGHGVRNPRNVTRLRTTKPSRS